MLPNFRNIESIRREPFLETMKVMDIYGNIYVAKNYLGPKCIQPSEQIAFFTALNNISKIEYPSILPIYCYNLFNIEKQLYPIIITKYQSKNSLHNLFNMIQKGYEPINCNASNHYIIILGIALGMNYLHSKNIVHHNLKPTNILLDDNFYPKICDIDLFKHFSKNQSKSNDVFCFAQIVYEFLTNKKPPIQLSNIGDIQLRKFFNRCISNNESEIPSFKEVLDFISIKSFRNLFGQINMNKVIQYLQIFDKNQDDGEAFVIHGMINFESDSIWQRKETPFLLKKAADLGCVSGMIKYACYLSKLDTQGENKEEIMSYFQKAIDKGDANDIYMCASLIMKDCKSNEDLEKVGQIFKKSADKGFILSCYQYGIILYKLNKKKDAAKYLKIAADHGHAISMFNYASLLEKGNGIEININEAIEYYKKAIEKGHVNSMNNLACLIKNSKNKEDRKLAVFYFKKAADNGNSFAMCNYAYMCQIGQEIEENKEEAIIYYSKSIEKGNPKAMIQYGRMLELNNNIQEAIKYYKLAAEKNKTKAMNNLIALIDKGYETGLSKEEIIQYSKKAAEKGRINSLLFFSRMLYKDEIVDNNKDESIKYLKKSIDKGNSSAMNEYGRILESDNKIKEAVYFYKKAIDNGNKDAIQYYYNIIEKNENVFVNDDDKEQYIKLAADNGNIQAMYKYALILKNKKPQPFVTYFGLNLLDNPSYKASKYFRVVFRSSKNFDDNIAMQSLNYYFEFIYNNKKAISKLEEKENTSFYKLAAESGNAIGMLAYGLCLKNGIGVEKNYEEAFRYVKMASDLNNPFAYFHCGEFYEKGIGTDIILEESKKYYLKSIENGRTRAYYNYGCFLLKTNKESQNEALHYLKTAADNGHKDAGYLYAKKLEKNKDSSKEEIKFYYKKSADLGNTKSMHNYAVLCLNENIENEAKKYFKKAAEKGYVNSMLFYAIILENENPCNYKLTHYYYKKAADSGNECYLIEYGKYMQSDENPYMNLKIAAEYFKKAADKGSEDGEKNYIKIISENPDFVTSKNELFSLMKRGAELKVVNAIYKYGTMLKNGDGVEADKEKAFQYILEAAELGNIDAISDYTSEIILKNGIVNYDFEHFEEEAKKYKKILLDYKNDNNEVFIDENFPPLKNWKRVDDIYHAPLFKQELISPNFVNQGSIGDCYLIASLSRIAKQYYLVPQLFERYLPNLILGRVENSINIKCGAVVIYFQAFGRRTPVLIDTFIPMQNDKPICSFPSDSTKSPWFCLVEKAYAKLCGSFSNASGGFSSNGIYSLFFYYPKIKHAVSFQKIMKYQEKGYLISPSFTKNKQNEPFCKGLISDHSYFLFKAREIDGEKLISLRNPWGKNKFKGKYTENSPYWTPQKKKILGYDDIKNGTFFMTDEEFFPVFNYFEIIKPILPEWNIKSFQYQFLPGLHDGVDICNPDADFPNRQSFALQVIDSIPYGKFCSFHIVVEMRFSTFKDRIQNKDNSKYCLIIGRLNGKKFDQVAAKNPLAKYISNNTTNINSFSFDIDNNYDIITIALHRFQKHDYVENCYVSIFCDYKFKLYDIDNPQQPIPNSYNPGIVFENFTVSFPKISKPLALKFYDNRFVLSFGSITSHDNIFDQEDFEKLLQYVNKRVDSSCLKLEDFTLNGNLLGFGSNGKVYPVEEIKTKKNYAAKIIYHLVTNKRFLREFTILRSIKYPSIINFKGFIEKDFIDKQFPTLIMEKLNQDSLFHVLQKESLGNLSDDVKNKWTRTKKMINIIGIALGMDYLHRHNIIHRDLKFQNILHDENLYPKICDFGDAKFIENESASETLFVGTELYMAPEIAKGDNKYSYPVDVYSFGIMLYFLYSFQVPKTKACSIDFYFLDKKYQPFVSKLIDPEPKNRPTFGQIINELLYERDKTWIEGADENEVELYLHKFGLSIKPNNHVIDFNVISSINEDSYPIDAKKPKLTIQQIIKNDLIPQSVKDDILLAESYINSDLSTKTKDEIDDVSNLLCEVGSLFTYGKNESIFTIQEDLYYAIKFLQKAALCKNSYALCFLAMIFSNDSSYESHKIAFNAALISTDLGSVDGYLILGTFYQNGVATNKNIAMSAIYFKIAADRGNILAMMYYANILMRIGQHEIDFNEQKNQIVEAENLIHQMEGKPNYFYNEARLTIEALENEYVALYVSQRYFEKASKNGNKEAEEKLNLIRKSNYNFDNHPQYYDDLFLTLN